MAKKQPVSRIDEIDRLLQATKRNQEAAARTVDATQRNQKALARLMESIEPLLLLMEKVADQNQKAWDALATIYQSAKLLSPEAGDMVAQVLAVMADVTANQPTKRAKKAPAKKARKKPGA